MWVLTEGVVTCGTIIWGMETVGVLISIAYATAGQIAAARDEESKIVRNKRLHGTETLNDAAGDRIAPWRVLRIRRALHGAAALTYLGHFTVMSALGH